MPQKVFGQEIKKKEKKTIEYDISELGATTMLVDLY